MRHGYGYPQDECALYRACVDRIFLDAPKGDRHSRADMLDPVNLRAGDTIVMVDPGRLGRGREVPQLRKRIADMGVGIEIIRPYAKKTGRPPTFAPNDDQDSQLRQLWHSAYQIGYVLAEASRVMGWSVKRHHMTHAYGARYQDAK